MSYMDHVCRCPIRIMSVVVCHDNNGSVTLPYGLCHARKLYHVKWKSF